MRFIDWILNLNSNHKLEIHNHGHRCYTEGLNLHEQALVNVLAKGLDSDKYFIFNNITLPSSHTISSQVDHVVVSEYGIFVIESKDYKGWIFGDKNSKEWTVCYRNRQKFRFQNPIFQNFAHVSALKEQLPFLNKCFFSVIVFSEESTFKTETIPNVVQDHDLIDYITSKTKKWLQEDEVTMTVGKLLMLCQTYNIGLESHVDNLKSIHAPTRKYLSGSKKVVVSEA